MPRLAKYDEGQILGAAAKLVAANGPGAATMTAIGAALGAPNGSIYHRFRSRDELLGRLWLSKARAFQDSWAAGLTQAEPLAAGLEAALSMPRVVRADIEGARIMLLHRREDFLSDAWPQEMKAEAERLGRQVKDTLSEMTRRLFGRDTTSARRATAFATIDIPVSAVRRFVSEGGAPPAQIDEMIACAYRAVIEQERGAANGA
ncbi:TetR/AcrR family transcriptional regulator [Bosea vestrisii]|uniref:TetR/AcrR family transcriptional regulator n=1 Tax=Bosea vestrisii TaxID=151416 RepID=A0ABW0HLH2_9HYPH